MNFLTWGAATAFSGAWLVGAGFYQRSQFGAAILFVLLGAGALVIAMRRGGWSRGSIAVAIAGIASLHLLLVPIVFRLSAHVHALQAPALPIAASLELLGVDAWRDQATLHVQAASHLVPVLVSTESLALVPVVALVLTGIALLALARQLTVRGAVLIAGLTAAYVVLRMVGLLLVVLHGEDILNLEERPVGETPVALLVRPFWQWITTAPLALLLARAVPLRLAAPAPRSRREPLVAAAARGVSYLAAGALIAAGLLYLPVGQAKSGRVVVDELHSREWATASRTLDTEWFGRESVYNLATTVELLRERYRVTVNESRRYDDAGLADVDVLIVKPPTTAFEPEEIEAIERWVAAGGGLFLIGDHTDLLGMMSNLNELADRFGFRFNLDASNRLEDGQFVVHEPVPWLVHPVLRGVDSLTFMTSCTLDVPLDAEPVLVAGNTFSDPLDYRSFSFFGNVRPDLSDAFGVHVLGAGFRVGAGRVLAFSDSTLLSTFAITQEKRPEFLLQSVEYLNRTQADSALPEALLWTGLGLLALAWLTRAARARGGLVQHLPLVLGGALAGAVWATAASRIDIPEPREVPASRIAFVLDRGQAELPPALVELRSASYQAFDTFYVWCQRLGLVPRQRTLDEALDEALDDEVMVLINPDVPFSRAEVRAVHRWVDAGGRLIVMDTVLNARSTANELLSSFGMRLTYEVRSFGGGEGDGPAVTPVARFDGGAPVLLGPDANVLVRQQPVGAGRVYCVADSIVFSRVGMGQQTADERTADVAANHASHFALFRHVLDLGAASDAEGTR
ncbi:MAG: hypothetical protein IPM29_24805 [Planctomycetes bacterium]|nr:hypothetical protein [Planctomycetota bacterium]